MIRHLTVDSEELISKPASLINMLKTENKKRCHDDEFIFYLTFHIL